MLDNEAMFFREGYKRAISECYEKCKFNGLTALEQFYFSSLKKNYRIGVFPREGSYYSLYCFDCGEWVPNTSPSEIKLSEGWSHSHTCKKV